MFNNYPNNFYNPQPSLDRINDQINQLENMKKQLQQPIQQPTNLTQNFQLAPSNNKDVIKYANNIEEVERDMVIGDTPYFSKDMSVVWIKNTQNQIKTYELNEVVIKDDKDLMIESLQMQLKEMKGLMKDAESNVNDVYEPIESKKSSNVSKSKSSNVKSK